MDNLFSVQDQIVVVTGELGQLGCQYTRVLLARGAKVAVFDYAVRPELIAKHFPNAEANDCLMFVQVDATVCASIQAEKQFKPSNSHSHEV